jgi:hypothetical protein
MVLKAAVQLIYSSWLYNISGLFLLSIVFHKRRTITPRIKADWLAAGVLLREIGIIWYFYLNCKLQMCPSQWETTSGG